MSKSVELARLIRDRAGDQPPEYGLILGSGLGHLSGTVDGVAIPPMTTCRAFPMRASRAMCRNW
jgi:purine nucleoside phosphorylase